MKKIVMGGVILAACTAMFVGASNVYAFVPGEEGQQDGENSQTVTGAGGITEDESTIKAKGTFYEFDPTHPDPGAPDPVDPGAWVNVKLPKTVIFGTAYLPGAKPEDPGNRDIFSPRYYIQNMSEKDVNVRVESMKHISSKINEFDSDQEATTPRLNLNMVLMDKDGNTKNKDIKLLSTDNEETDQNAGINNDSVDGTIPTIAGSKKELDPERRKQHFELRGTVSEKFDFNILQNHDRIKSIWNIVFSFSTPTNTALEKPEQPQP